MLQIEQLDEPTELKDDTCCICYSGSCDREIVITKKKTATQAQSKKAFSEKTFT